MGRGPLSKMKLSEHRLASLRSRRVPQDGMDNANAKHGLYAARRLLGEMDRAGAAIADSDVAPALAAWKDSVVDALGGQEAMSPQLETVIDVAARTKLILDAIDRFIFTPAKNKGRGSRIFNQTRKSLTRLAEQRGSITNALVSYMNVIGLERRAKQVEETTDSLRVKILAFAAAAEAAEGNGDPESRSPSSTVSGSSQNG